VAVSGGPDSLALLLLARDALGANAVMAATVDHRLRPGAADEARFVARLCAGLAIPHATLTPAQPIAGNLQSSARAARYALLEGWAQTNDSRTANGIRIVRPLLGWRRRELAAIVAAAGIDPIDDPSNHDERFDRVRLRRVLAEADWLDVPALARSATALAEADRALAWATARLRDSHVEGDGDARTLDPALPAELRRRLVLDLLAELSPASAPPRGPELDRFLTALAGGGTATLAGVKGTGGPRWRLSVAPARRTGTPHRPQDHCS
jgi:tRNA(Ile)-lysidine synthase